MEVAARPVALVDRDPSREVLPEVPAEMEAQGAVVLLPALEAEMMHPTGLLA